jgi:2-polyprenylphenol 6-hydroxylase
MLNDPQPERFDAIVVGGGLVGACAALALARDGRAVALVDRRRPTIHRGALGFDLRTVALNHASAALLAELGIWSKLDVCVYQRVAVWEEAGTALLTFTAEEAGVADLGAIAEVGNTTALLWAAADALPNVTIVCADVDAIDASANGAYPIRVALGARSMATHLLVAADGADSTVRRLLGVPAALRPSPHTAIATVIETARPHEGTALQCFLRDGPLALLPLPQRDGRHYCSVVWSQSPDVAERRLALDDMAFAHEVESASARRLGSVRAVDRRVAVPLRQQLADDFCPRPGIVLIGDAARVLHPLAGQGVNVGLEDVLVLSEIAARVPPSAWSGADVWRSFARRRRLRARMMLAAMDAFRRAYGLDDPLRSFLRNRTVAALNTAVPIKRTLIREALGAGAFALVPARAVRAYATLHPGGGEWRL